MSRCNHTVFNQLIQEIPFTEFQKKVNELKADKGVSKINSESLLLSLIYAQLSDSKTLRELEDGFLINQVILENLGINSMQRSSMSEALSRRNPEVFEYLFKYLLKSTLSAVSNKKSRKLLKLLDSTTISFSKSLHEWAEFRESKSGIKVHLLFDDKRMLPLDASITNASVNDTQIVDELEIHPGDTFVFDRAYNIFKWWHKIKTAKAFFVTRMKKGTRYEVLERIKSKSNEGVLEDNIIHLTGKKKTEYPDKLRLIKYYDAVTKKHLTFVTNNFSLKAQTVADYYKRRWITGRCVQLLVHAAGIELFFKFIKQHLKVKKFLSRSKNGVYSQIWCAL